MSQTNLTYARRWLWLGVTALAVAGIFSIILVAARTPQLAAFKELFGVSLVVHVDLSVLMWFLAMAGMGWALLVEQSPVKRWSYWQGAGFWTVATATALIALSPLDPHWEVVKSNYIPVLNNLPFLLGLAVLFAGLAIVLTQVIAAGRGVADEPTERGFFYAAMTTALALVLFLASGQLIPEGLPLQLRFETLFWAGGHTLQFTYTLLMTAAWLAILQVLSEQREQSRWVEISYLLTLLAAVISAAGFILYPFDSPEFIHHQTWAMQWFGGLGVAVMLPLVLKRLWQHRAMLKQRAKRAYTSSIIASIVVFTAGGALGILIEGQNVTIPAHYHGAIVGVTLAMMGLAYAMLPRFGYMDVAGTRLAFLHPIFYGVGQLLHIGGLGYSGGYGVLRKTPGGAEHMALDVKIAMGVMGMGGLLAIIGGLMFVVVMVNAAHRGSQTDAV